MSISSKKILKKGEIQEGRDETEIKEGSVNVRACMCVRVCLLSASYSRVCRYVRVRVCVCVCVTSE